MEKPLLLTNEGEIETVHEFKTLLNASLISFLTAYPLMESGKVAEMQKIVIQTYYGK